MSTMLLGYEIFDNVLRTLQNDAHQGHIDTIVYKVKPLMNDYKRFVRLCFALNTRSHRIAYSHRFNDESPRPSCDYVPDSNAGKVLSLPELYKTLECIEYNIDVDCPCTEKLTAYLVRIAKLFLKQSDEYEKAKWGD